MFRILVFLLVFFSLSIHVMAQKDIEAFSEDVLLRKEYAGGVFVHSQGGGIHFQKGFNKDYFTKWLYEFDLLEMKSLKEISNVNTQSWNSRSYIFGKLNNVFILRGGGGQQKLITRKPYFGGMEVRYFWFGGGSVALAKPYYFNIIEGPFTSQFFEVYYTITTQKFDPTKHSYDNIYGRASFFKGFNEMKFYPGLYAKAGFSFDFSRQNTVLRAVETGAVLDFFPKAIPIMAIQNPHRFFLTMFISFHIGKRYD